MVPSGATPDGSALPDWIWATVWLVVPSALMYKPCLSLKNVNSPADCDARAVVLAPELSNRATTYLSSAFTSTLKKYGIAGLVSTFGIGKPCSDVVVSSVVPDGWMDASAVVGAVNVSTVPLEIRDPATVWLFIDIVVVVTEETVEFAGTFVPDTFQPAATEDGTALKVIVVLLATTADVFWLIRTEYAASPATAAADGLTNTIVEPVGTFVPDTVMPGDNADKAVALVEVNGKSVLTAV